MPGSVWSQDVQRIVDQARAPGPRTVRIREREATIPRPFPSPADWRDQWIYFLLVDRFNNPGPPPRVPPWDGPCGTFQGGTFEGIRQQLPYLRDLGVGALWLSPVLKNCQFDPHSYHGYGIQDFVAIDPRYASAPGREDDELIALIDAAHALGIYVIFDIVLHHAGDVFAYVLPDGTRAASAPWSDQTYTINWRDADGQPREDWTDPPPQPPADATIWPAELQRDVLLGRQGNVFTRPQGIDGAPGGDFESLKGIATSYAEFDDRHGQYFPARDALIHAYQYVVAKFDVDAFRIDTLKYIDQDFAQTFGNAMREFALSIGKANFFTFGEVYDANEQEITRFIGRNATVPGDLVGVDAALDFPLFFRLPTVAKGIGGSSLTPADVAQIYQDRKKAELGTLSSHGEASRFFVTFLDNHDQHQRFYFSDPNGPHRYDDQVALAVGCLFALQGIPCLYYGTEQGLHGSGGQDLNVREALWGKPNAFDPTHPLYEAIQKIATTRSQQPALRYGRQYFRPISGDGTHFGLSTFPAGVLAFSRILQDQEVLVVANTNTTDGWPGEVIVDFALNAPDYAGAAAFDVLYSNKPAPTPPDPVRTKAANTVEIHEVDGSITNGPARTIRVSLQPMEIQMLRRR